MNNLVEQNKSTVILDEEEIDLSEYLHVLGRHKWGIFWLTLLSGLFSILVVFSMEPIYSSTATLLIEPGTSNVVSIEDVYGIDVNDEYYKTQHELLKSNSLARRVIEQLNLSDHAEFLPDPEESFISFDWRSWIKSLLPADQMNQNSTNIDADEQTREKLLTNFLARLTVAPVRGSQLVKLSFEAHDRKLAATIANTVAETYIVSDMEAKLHMTSKASSWLTERLDALRVKLRESEKSLQEYREREKLIEVDGVATLTAQNLQELGQQLVEAQQSRVLAQSSLRQVQSLKNATLDMLSTIPAVLKDPLYATLKQREAKASQELSALQKRYGSKHPKLIQAKANLKDTTASVKRHIQSIIKGLEKEYQVARNNESAIKASMGQAKGAMQSINRKGYQLRVLEREVESNRQLYDLFLGRFKETDETGGLDKASARIADPASASINPIKPKKSLIIMISTLLGLFVGVIIAFLLEHLDNTIKSSDDIEDKLNLPLLGVLPHLQLKKKDNDNSFTYALTQNQSFFAESVRTVRTSVLLTGLDSSMKILVVTSAVPGEGKSTVSTNLALMMSDMHKVLLIDADLRRPRISSALQINEQTNGLTEFVAGSAELSACIEKAKEGNTYVMLAGSRPSNPLEMLSSKRFSSALKQLSQEFDYIIIDCAPTLAVSDALVLSSYADGVIYVAKADETPVSAMQEGLKRLRRVDANLIGVVLNNVPEAKKKSRYGKHGYYYGSYGYTESS